jgi:hypothetical protein
VLPWLQPHTRQPPANKFVSLRPPIQAPQYPFAGSRQRSHDTAIGHAPPLHPALQYETGRA